MSRIHVRTLGLVALVVCGFSFADSAFAQEQGWPLQGRGGRSNSYSSQPARAVFYAPARFAARRTRRPRPCPATASTPIEVRLPTGAKLSFNGIATTPTGMVRNFVASRS